MLTFPNAWKRQKLSKLTNEIASFEVPKSDILIESQAWCEPILVFLDDLTNPCVKIFLDKSGVNLALITILQ